MRTNLQTKAQEQAAPPLLLNLWEAAHMLGLSVRYLRMLYVRGDIPIVRMGRRTLMRRSDVEAIVARGALSSEAQP